MEGRPARAVANGGGVFAWGLPPPEPAHLLTPQMSPAVFPAFVPELASTLSLLQRVEDEAEWCPPAEDDRLDIEAKVGEAKVRLLAAFVQRHAKALTHESAELLVLLAVKELFTDKSSAVPAAWLLLDPMARIMGRRRAVQHFLEDVLLCYESHDGNGGERMSTKRLKLFHRTFLQILLARFGAAVFLKYFSAYLVEAVGGYKDFVEGVEDSHPRPGLERAWILSTGSSSAGPSSRPESASASGFNEEEEEVAIASTACRQATDDCDRPVDDTFSEGEVFAFDALSLVDGSSDKGPKKASTTSEKDEEDIYIPPVSSYEPAVDGGAEGVRAVAATNISGVAAESVLWLAHRVGPVLTARYLTKNLLRMLNLCYSGLEALQPVPGPFVDHRVRLTPRRIYGDVLAEHVLQCLGEIAALYGEQIILVQYFPYCWDLLNMARKKMTPTLEGGLIGALALSQRLATYLSDGVLMNELPDNVMAGICMPALQIFTSRTLIFAGGWRARQVAAFRLLDLVYLIGLRIGEEMARTHMTTFCSAFFSAFDKAGPAAEDGDLGRALTPELCYNVYVTFYNLFGRAHLEENILNIAKVRSLCLHHQENAGLNLWRPATFECLRSPVVVHPAGIHSSSDSPASGSNKIQPSGLISAAARGSFSGGHDVANEDLHGYLSRDVANTTRHLRGNWLAHWETEAGRAESDESLNVRQIPLQTYIGHAAAVKCIDALDSENSFLTASRDKTVKVWSLRSQGDGSESVGPQWTFAQHKKGVFFTTASFIENLRQVASCDGVIHLWDPFVGAAVSQVDTPTAVTALTVVDQPAPLLVSAAADGTALLRLIDCRTAAVVHDLKVPPAGLVRSLGSTEGGHGVIVGHSSGTLSVLDLRTGKLRHQWKVSNRFYTVCTDEFTTTVAVNSCLARRRPKDYPRQRWPSRRGLWGSAEWSDRTTSSSPITSCLTQSTLSAGFTAGFGRRGTRGYL